MPGTVNQYQQGAFTVPVNDSTNDAAEVLANDNTLRSKYNSHDADPTIHVQSSTLAARPAAGIAQRVWVTTDGKRVYVDTGSAWAEIDYFNSTAGGTIAGATTFSAAVTHNADILFGDALYDIGKNGATRPRDLFLSRNLVVGGGSTFGTITSHLFFTDATYDIGASGATRPRDLFLSRNATVGGTVTVSGGAGAASLSVPTTGRIYLDGGSNTYIYESASDNIAFVTAGTLRVQIASDGRVILGTTIGNTQAGVYFYLSNTSAHTGTPTGGGVVYVEAGALKYKGTSGTVTTLGVA